MTPPRQPLSFTFIFTTTSTLYSEIRALASSVETPLVKLESVFYVLLTALSGKEVLGRRFHFQPISRCWDSPTVIDPLNNSTIIVCFALTSH